MRVFSYKRLFKKLIDLDMTNNELMEKAKVSKSTFYKMKNGQNVTTDVSTSQVQVILLPQPPK